MVPVGVRLNELFYIVIAQAGADGGASSTGAGMLQLFPLVLIFVVFYFLVIRPQQKRQREHRDMLDRLKKGDAVVTNGGLIGKVAALADDRLTLELADKVKVRVLRTHIAALETAAETNPAAQKGR